MVERLEPDREFAKEIGERFASRSEPATVEDIVSLLRIIVQLQQNFMDVAQVVLVGREFRQPERQGLIDRYHQNIEIVGETLTRLQERVRADG